MTSNQIFKYIISGSNFFVEKNVKRILSAHDDPEIMTYYGDDFDKGDFFTFIYSLPLFSSIKIAVVKNSEKIRNIITDFERIK